MNAYFFGYVLGFPSGILACRSIWPCKTTTWNASAEYRQMLEDENESMR